MSNGKDTKDKSPNLEEQTEMSRGTDSASEAKRPKRRPGREEPEASEAEVRVVDVEHGLQGEEGSELLASSETGDRRSGASAFEAEPEKPKVEIRFFGSELIRAKLPKPFEVAEAVATDWMNGGEFDQLPINHPLAQFAAQKGLLKAKEVEKKLLESPVTEKVAMQVLTAGMKAQSLIEQLRSKLKKD